MTEVAMGRDEAVYPRAKPAERCPNCGGWFVMGHCRHMASTQSGTLYGVCAQCACEFERFGRWLETGKIDTDEIRAMLEAAR